MLLSMLDFFDFLIIGLLIMVFAGGTTMVSRRSAVSAAAGERLRRMEDKLNLLLVHNGIDYVPRTKENWQRLADDRDREKAALEYSEAHSVPLKEAEEVVAQYLEDVTSAN